MCDLDMRFSKSVTKARMTHPLLYPRIHWKHAMTTFQAELHDIQPSIWKEFTNAISNRQHGWRTPILATISPSGLPDARTVVLREVDPVKQQLTFYTDERSPKVLHIAHQPQVSLVFWCAKLNWQLRIQAIAKRSENQERTHNVWQQVRETAGANDYLSIQAPSSPLHEDGLLSKDNNALCIIDLNIQSIDWLSLNRKGHTRAKIEKDQLTWLTP